MKYFLHVLILTSISLSAYTQNSWDSWNENYIEKNVPDLLILEKLYADSVDKGLIEGKHYSRMSNYRFSAQFTGERRQISDSVKSSMTRVYKLFGNRANLSTIEAVKYEYEFIIANNRYWFAMQLILDKPFKKEIKKNVIVHLYSLYLNEHTSNGTLYNSFLISEFRKE